MARETTYEHGGRTYVIQEEAPSPGAGLTWVMRAKSPVKDALYESVRMQATALDDGRSGIEVQGDTETGSVLCTSIESAKGFAAGMLATRRATRDGIEREMRQEMEGWS